MTPQARPPHLIIGILATPALALSLAGATAMFWPDGAAIGTFARIAEGLSIHLLVAGMILSVVICLLGARWIGAVLLGIALCGLGNLGLRHVNFAHVLPGPAGLSRPVFDPTAPRLRVLWFNVLSSNSHSPDQLLAALRDSDADVLALGEANNLAPHLSALADIYPYRLGCDSTPCSSVLLSRLPLQNAEILPSQGRGMGPGRTLVAQVTPPNAAPVTVMAIHMVKPWFYGFAELEEWWMFKNLQNLPTPLVMMGDFNAAPWSQRLTTLYLDCGLVPVARPPATWPAKARGFGVPIDHVLTRGGAHTVSLDPWGGAELGSNHRGLLAEIALSDAPAPPCHDPRTHDPVPPTTGMASKTPQGSGLPVRSDG